MKTMLDRLNLRPVEQRLVVAVAAIFFVVLNLWLVWPHFKDWRRLRRELGQAEQTLQVYEEEMKRQPEYEAKLVKLKEGGGSDVLPEDRAIQLLRDVQNQASQHGVVIVRTTPSPKIAGRTNAFFEEQSVTISVISGEKELVDFLVGVGSGGSMIRVRDLDLKPDPPQQRLGGTITLVASYQKNAPKPAAAPKPVAAPKPPEPKTKIEKLKPQPRPAAPPARKT